MGCLRNENLFNLKKNQKQIKIKIKKSLNLGTKKNILIAPSLNDLDDILLIIEYLNKFKDINILLRRHPAINKFNIFQIIQKLDFKLEIKIIDDFSTYELLCISDLVISGDSTVPFEAAFLGIPSVRVVPRESFPLYENDNKNLIPYINNKKDFLLWFRNFRKEEKKYIRHKSSLLKLSNQFYYKIDGKVQERFWKILKKTQEDSVYKKKSEL